MDKISYYEEQIEKYEILYEVCIQLIEFESFDYKKKNKLREYETEIAKSANYNRIKTVERTSEKAKENIMYYSDIDEIIAKLIKKSKYSDEVKEYRKEVSELIEIGPKKYLVECLKKIVHARECIKDEISKEKSKSGRKRSESGRKRSESLGLTRGYTPTYDSITIPKRESISEIKSQEKENESTVKTTTTIKTTKDIKKRVVESDYITDSDIEAIKEEYELKDLSYSGFASRDTIESLIRINDAKVGLSNRYKVRGYMIAEAFNRLYKVAIDELKEISRNDMSLKMDRVKRSFGVDDFVDTYANMYSKLIAYINFLSGNAKQEFSEDFYSSLSSDLKGGSDGILSPEEFRKKLNRDIEPEIMDNAILNGDNIHYLGHKTKYMNAEEISQLFYKMQQHTNQHGSFDCSTIKETCVKLIAARMPELDEKDPNYVEEVNKRKEAILQDYFGEEKSVEKGYARKLIEKEELVTEKKKEYFRMSKFKQAIELMSFGKLMRLGKKSVLTEGKIESVKRMF